MYPPQSNSINTDQQNIYHQKRLKDPARVVSASPIGITVPNIEIKPDFTQQLSTDNLYRTGLQSANSILQDSNQLQIQSSQTTSYQTTIDSQLSRECPPIEISPNHIKYLLENHQTQTKWPIGGRLIHFLDIWKLIKAETLITRESIQRELRSTRSTNLEGAAGRNSRGSVPELTEMDQSLLCNTEEGSGKMEKDNR
ncbi:MAG: hypothetical protein EZS28_053247, partial [Streblomastix strix]